MEFGDTLLQDINPFPSHQADGWSESSAGQRTLVRVLDQASDGVAAFDQEPENRRWPWLVAAAVVVVVALGVPTAILMRSTGTVAPGGGAGTGIDGVWILNSFDVLGKFTHVEVGVNTALPPTIDIGSTITGNTGCNDFTAYGDGLTVNGEPQIFDEVVATRSALWRGRC